MRQIYVNLIFCLKILHIYSKVRTYRITISIKIKVSVNNKMQLLEYASEHADGATDSETLSVVTGKATGNLYDE
jgi:hypothetical protein